MPAASEPSESSESRAFGATPAPTATDPSAPGPVERLDTAPPAPQERLTIRESYWILPAAGVLMLVVAMLGLAMLIITGTRSPADGPGGQGDSLAQVINITTALLLGALWTRVPLHQTTTFDREAGVARTETRQLWTSRITTTPLHEIVAVVTATDNHRAYARLQLASGGTRPLCSATRLLRWRGGLPASITARATQVAAWLDVPLHHQT